MGNEYDFTLVMPGRIKSFSQEDIAHQIRANTVTWNLALLDSGEFELEAISEINRIPWTWIIFGLCCGAVVLLVVVAGLTIRSKRASIACEGLDEPELP
jgi:hypothetical protein